MFNCSDKLRLVSYRHADRHGHSIYCTSIASRGKKELMDFGKEKSAAVSRLLTE